jgi:hypothetical protein
VIRIRSKIVNFIAVFVCASFVSNLNDSALNKLLVRSDEKRSNLLNLKCLRLKSTDISDVSVRVNFNFFLIWIFVLPPQLSRFPSSKLCGFAVLK